MRCACKYQTLLPPAGAWLLTPAAPQVPCTVNAAGWPASRRRLPKAPGRLCAFGLWPSCRCTAPVLLLWLSCCARALSAALADAHVRAASSASMATALPSDPAGLLHHLAQFTSLALLPSRPPFSPPSQPPHPPAAHSPWLPRPCLSPLQTSVGVAGRAMHLSTAAFPHLISAPTSALPPCCWGLPLRADRQVVGGGGQHLRHSRALGDHDSDGGAG